MKNDKKLFSAMLKAHRANTGLSPKIQSLLCKCMGFKYQYEVNPFSIRLNLDAFSLARGMGIPKDMIEGLIKPFPSLGVYGHCNTSHFGIDYGHAQESVILATDGLKQLHAFHYPMSSFLRPIDSGWINIAREVETWRLKQRKYELKTKIWNNEK